MPLYLPADWACDSRVQILMALIDAEVGKLRQAATLALSALEDRTGSAPSWSMLEAPGTISYASRGAAGVGGAARFDNFSRGRKIRFTPIENGKESGIGSPEMQGSAEFSTAWPRVMAIGVPRRYSSAEQSDGR